MRPLEIKATPFMKYAGSDEPIQILTTAFYATIKSGRKILVQYFQQVRYASQTEIMKEHLTCTIRKLIGQRTGFAGHKGYFLVVSIDPVSDLGDH